MGRERKDAGGEEVPRLPSFLNIISSCYLEVTEAKAITVKRQARKNWRTRFSETDLLASAQKTVDTQDGPTLPFSHPGKTIQVYL